MRVLVYGLMALALSLSAVLVGVHHSGADAHAAAAPVPGHVAHSEDGVAHGAVSHDASAHSNATVVPDAHPAGSAEGCVTCGHDGESMLLVACALLAVLISLAAAVHPARTGLITRTEAAQSSRPRPPDESGASGAVDLDQLCVSRR